MNASSAQHVHQISMNLRQLSERIARAGFISQSRDGDALLMGVETHAELATAAGIVAAYRAWDRLDVDAPNVLYAFPGPADTVIIHLLNGTSETFGVIEINSLTYAKDPFPPARFVQAAAAALAAGASADELLAEALRQFAAMLGCAAEWPAIIRAIHAAQHFMQAHFTLGQDFIHLTKPEAASVVPQAAVDAVRAVVPEVAEIFVSDRCAVVVTHGDHLVPLPDFADTKADVKEFANRWGLNAKRLWAAVGELEKSCGVSSRTRVPAEAQL